MNVGGCRRGEVNERNMFMGIIDPMTVYESWRKKFFPLLKIADLNNISRERNIQPDFFLCFTNSGFRRILARFDMAANAQPNFIFIVFAKQNLIFVDDKNI